MKPLIQSFTLRPPSEELIQSTMDHYKVSREIALARIEKESAGCSYWINDVYQVEVRPAGDSMVQLNIRRRDGKVIFRDWREFQEIKNQLVGPECEAIELYPAESRKVDTTNKYHLWACTDPSFRFPIGWTSRDVVTEGGGKKGLRQRPAP